MRIDSLAFAVPDGLWKVCWVDASGEKLGGVVVYCLVVQDCERSAKETMISNWRKDLRHRLVLDNVSSIAKKVRSRYDRKRCHTTPLWSWGSHP